MSSTASYRLCISLLQRCSSLHHLQSIHAHLITTNLSTTTTTTTTTFILSRLVLAACSLSPPSLSYASLIFHHHSPSPLNPFLFNTLIRAYSRSSLPFLSLSYFLSMHRLSVSPDHHTFPFVLSACASVPSPSIGAQIHSLLVRNGLSSADPFVQTGLLRFYTRLDPNNLALARNLFDEIPYKDAVHVDVLMNAYLRMDSPEKALSLFRCMACIGVVPDAHVIATALTACAHAGVLDLGVWIHRHLLSDDGMLKGDSHIASALINMYAKCGSIGDAVRVFETAVDRCRNTFAWSALISGFAMHGLAKDAIRCLHRMQEEGLRPDGVVILGVLAACAHAGLVNDGLLILSEMESQHRVVPRHEHYSCAVDMLCRVGLLKDAVKLIGGMPMRPLASVWGSLLTGCRIYKNVELAELAVEELKKLTSEGGDDEGVYIQLSNIYMNANKLDDARRVRKLVGSRGMKKTAACSSIEVDGDVSSFVAGDKVHPMRVGIDKMVELLTEDCSCDSLRDLEHGEGIIMCLE